MIKFTKYFWAHIIAMMGIVLLILADVGNPSLFSFFGGFFIGVGLRLSREFGEEKIKN
jgi:hypothetical protein